MTSAAITESTGCGSQRFLRAQSAAHVTTSGNGLGFSHPAGAPVYGTNRSPVPWNAIIGTGLVSLHHLEGRVWAADTAPTAAIRRGRVQDKPNTMPPPLENPLS